MDLNVPVSGTITDVDLHQLDIDHTWIRDMRIDLVHPGGTTVRVWNRNCAGENNMFTSFDDESTATVYDCPPINGGFFPPSTDALSDFDGLDAAGTWELRIRDDGNDDGGALNAFSVKLCLTNVALPVTYLSFNAEGKKDHIALNWATATESGNYGFFVERSRQQDIDGRVTYSEVRTARFGETSEAVNLYPNPTTNNVQYRIPGAGSNLPYTMIDVNGRVLESGILNAEGGTLKLEDKAAGVYFLRVAESTLRVVRL